jgi:hypothetical protein
MGVVDVGHRCPPRIHDGSDRPEPSMSLGCPSVARRRSRRRLRNVGHEPSMGVIDVDHRAHSRSHAGKPTPRATRSAVSPSGATDGHPRWLEGSSKSLPSSWSKGSNRSIPPDGSDRRRSSTSSSISPWSDRPEPSMSLGCPSVARRRSRRRLRNVGHEPSMGVIDVGRRPRAHPRSHAGKPTPRATRSAVSPSGATDGHPRWLEGSNKSLRLRSMTARVAGLGSLTESTEDTEE